MTTKLWTPRTWVDSPAASRDPMSEFNVNRELHDMVDFLQNAPFCIVFGAGTSIATGTVSVVSWSATAAFTAPNAYEDSDSMFNSSFPTRLTAPLAGVYEVMTCLLYASNAAGRRLANITRNGTQSFGYRSQVANTSAGAATEVFFRADVRMAVGDYVEVNGWQDSGGALTANTNFSGDSYFTARWVRR